MFYVGIPQKRSFGRNILGYIFLIKYFHQHAHCTVFQQLILETFSSDCEATRPGGFPKGGISPRGEYFKGRINLRTNFNNFNERVKELAKNSAFSYICVGVFICNKQRTTSLFIWFNNSATLGKTKYFQLKYDTLYFKY